jgi:hypothetical protein
MPLDFPANPSPNDTYSFGGKTWIWNGEYWRLQSAGSINDIPIGNVTANTGNFTTLSVQTGVSSNLIPTANVTYDLGNTANRWNDLWLANSTIYLGEAQISASGANLVLPATVQIGNATLSESDGNLSLPENIAATTVVATGNVSGGNLVTVGVISASGNITGNYILGNGSQLTGVTAGLTKGQVMGLMIVFGR